ncbi:MAG: HD domain-containing protein, partial [Planctomycetota bacterium]|nr:HD domain-containing protein [Planctomycetota bacterium]
GAPGGESVAGHVLGVAWLALTLAPEVAPPLDLGRCLAMAVLHDAPEAASGDLPAPAARHLPPGAKKIMEDALAEELVTPLGSLPEALFREYGSQETREAAFVHICDKLQLGVHLLRLERAGGGDLGQFHGVLESLDCADFAPCAELRAALLEELSDDRLAEHRGRSQ